MQIKIILIFILISIASMSCDNNTGSVEKNTNNNMRIIKDTFGKDITVPMDIKKIASISTTVTDIIIGLGFYDNLVLVDMFSDDVEPSLATNENIIKVQLLKPSIADTEGNYADAVSYYDEVFEKYPSDSWSSLAKSRALTLRTEGKAK